MSTLYESWITRLRLPWMGAVGRKIWGGFAAALGDRTYDWLQAGLKQAMPSYADAVPLQLIASERKLDLQPGEAQGAIAARAPFWLQLAKYRSTPLGIHLGLHFAGFDGAVLVQQNGVAWQLTLPLPDFVPGAAWDPTPNLVKTYLPQLSVPLHSDKSPGRYIPAGQSWFTFDSDTDLCSRFAVLFPGPLPGSFITSGTATFADGDTAQVTWNNPFVDTTYHVMPLGPVPSDGGEGVVAWCDASSKTTTGCTIEASGPWSGTVDVYAWQDGSNPFADPHPSDLQRLLATLKKWKPKKARCTGVYVLEQGRFLEWPPGTMDGLFEWPSEVVSLSGSF